MHESKLEMGDQGAQQPAAFEDDDELRIITINTFSNAIRMSN